MYGAVKIYFHNRVCQLSVNELKGGSELGAMRRGRERSRVLEDHVIDPRFPAITAAEWINSH